MKICNTCHRFKPLADYSVDASGRDGYRSSCRRCVTDAQIFRKEMRKDPPLKTLFERTRKTHQQELKFMAQLPPSAKGERERRIAEHAARVEAGR